MDLNERASTSSPSKPPKCVLYIVKENGNLIVEVWGAIFAGKKSIEEMAKGHTFERSRADTLVFDDGVTVRSEQLDEILAHEYSGQEGAWVLPRLRTSFYVRRAPYATAREVPVNEPPKAEAVARSKSPPTKSEPKPPRAPGLTSVADIAAQMGVEPRDARGALRKVSYVKPEAGWNFPSNEVDAVKAAITTGLKK